MLYKRRIDDRSKNIRSWSIPSDFLQEEKHSFRLLTGGKTFLPTSYRRKNIPSDFLQEEKHSFRLLTGGKTFLPTSYRRKNIPSDFLQEEKHSFRLLTGGKTFLPTSYLTFIYHIIAPIFSNWKTKTFVKHILIVQSWFFLYICDVLSLWNNINISYANRH